MSGFPAKYENTYLYPDSSSDNMINGYKYMQHNNIVANKRALANREFGRGTESPHLLTQKAALPPEEFGRRSLIHILENVDTLLKDLLQTKQSFSITPSISPNGEPSIIKESKNRGLDILLHTLQNTEKLLQTIIKPNHKNNSLSTVFQAATTAVSQAYQPVADYLNSAKKSLYADWTDPGDGPQRIDSNLDFGQDTPDFYKGNDVTIATNGTQSLINGRIEKPIEEEMYEVTKFRLIRDSLKSPTDNNKPTYKIVEETTTKNNSSKAV